MRDSFVIHWRDRDEKFKHGRSGEMRTSGMPPKAWFAALIDARTRTRLGFLSPAERTWLWTNFGEFLIDRHKDREAADVANADPPPDDGKEPADDGKEPADLVPHVDDRAHHRQAANPLFLDFEQCNVDVDGPNVALWTPENDNAVRASIADELKRLQLHPALAVDANPLSEWKKIEAIRGALLKLV